VAAVLPDLLVVTQENEAPSLDADVCTKLLRVFPQDALIRGEVLRFLERVQVDEKSLEGIKEIAASPDSTPEIVEWLIGRYVASGRTGEAIEFLKSRVESALACGDSDTAVRHLERVVELDPQDLESQRAKADILTALDRKEEAAKSWTAIGKREQEKGNPQGAHDSFGKAIAITPDWLPALREDFQIGLDAGEVSWVIRSTERLAQAYVEQDLQGKARETLQLALRRFPNETQLILVVIKHLRTAGATDRAADLALKLADLHLSDNRREEALRIYSEVAEFMPDNLRVWEKKASVEREILGYPACLETCLWLVDLYREKGLNGKRVESLEKLRTEYPASPEVWEESIKALEETGDR
jgi:tetratricopeptide (TPR) repeat protein